MITSPFDFLRPLTAEEYDGLKASIAANGQQFPIIRDQNGVTLDGHHRERALTELGMPLSDWKIEIRTFASDEDRIQFVIDANHHRRQVTTDDRRRLAEHLYKQGWTMERIGASLGVNVATISRALQGFLHDAKTSRPKGGRPKSPPKPRPRKYSAAIEQAAAAAVLDGGKGVEKVAKELGVSEQVVIRQVEREKGRREAKADPEIRLDDITSVPQRKRAEAFMRQYRKMQDLEFSERVRAQVIIQCGEYLGHLKEMQAKASAVVKSRKGVFTGQEFRLIQSSLHPDGDRSKERLHKAFQAFTAHKLVLLSEAEEPTRATDLPKTWAEMMQRKAQATAARKAARAAKKANTVDAR